MPQARIRRSPRVFLMACILIAFGQLLLGWTGVLSLFE